jgi:very-short-patch-repair endonuclease
VEYDGYAAHVDKAEADRARDEDLRRRGWKVLRADVSDLRDPTQLFRHLSVQLGNPERRTRAFRM